VTNNLRRGTRNLAFYFIQEDRLYIRGDLWRKDLLKTVLHELGHRFHLKLKKEIDPKVNLLYRRVQEGVRTNTRSFVTPYAKVGGPIENFAEMFSLWVQGLLSEQDSQDLEATIGLDSS
jgi:hypothetical protein